MKKTVIYGTLLILALLLPNDAVELGKMKPVETVLVRMEEETVVIETDTDDRGEGRTVAEALQNLHDTTAGTIYLDTTDYLLVTSGAEQSIRYLADILKPGVRLCYAEGEACARDAAQFLNVHKPAVTIEKYRSDVQLQTLSGKSGRMILK